MEGPIVNHGPVPSSRRNCLCPFGLRREGLAHSARFFGHGGAWVLQVAGTNYMKALLVQCGPSLSY